MRGVNRQKTDKAQKEIFFDCQSSHDSLDLTHKRAKMRNKSES